MSMIATIALINWIAFNVFVVLYLGILRYQKWKLPWAYREPRRQDVSNGRRV